MLGRSKKSSTPSDDSPKQSKGGIDWIWGIVDFLASEYGWTKDYIFYNIYIDEVFALKKESNKRHKNKILESIAIQHSDPNELVKELTSTNNEEYIEHTNLDKASFGVFKSKLTEGGGFIVKS